MMLYCLFNSVVFPLFNGTKNGWVSKSVLCSELWYHWYPLCFEKSPLVLMTVNGDSPVRMIGAALESLEILDFLTLYPYSKLPLELSC